MKSKFVSILTIVVIALIWLVPLTAQAAAPCAGFWGVDDYTYMTRNPSVDEMIAIIVYDDDGT